MFKKRIANIVFYKVPNGSETIKQATIFYSDGTVKNVDFEAGIDACEEIVQDRHIQTKDAFKEMINRDIVHVVSLKEFKDNFNRFVPEKIEIAEEDDNINSTRNVIEDEENKEEEIVEEIEDENDFDDYDISVEDSKDVAPIFAAAAIPSNNSDNEEDLHEFTTDEYDEVVEEEKEEENEIDPFDGEEDFDFEERQAPVEEEEEVGFFGRIWRKIKQSKAVKTVILCVTALAVACGIYSCAQRKTLEGEALNANFPGIEREADNLGLDDNDTIVLSDATMTDAEVLNSHFYQDAKISALLERTKSATQKTAMNNLGAAMDGFNNTFAHYYIEEGVDVRPALKFDEVVALQLAYNDYNKDQLRAYFNGADIRSDDLSRAYKDASLQLMGAYAIENREHPVDMSMLIESQEGKDFYNRYHEAFLKAKEATGDEKIRLVQEFYKMIHEDFAISQKERTEGISHAENYDRIEAYQLSVVPMVAAGEMMWQNLAVDATLTDEEVKFFNDFGLCNFADETFERAEYITLAAETDKENPTYDEYRQAFIDYYTRLGIYYIDDEHRELTLLQSFQDAVNWHFQQDGEWVWGGKTWTETTTRTEVKHWEEKTTKYWEEETRTKKDIPDNVKREIDEQIEKENQREKEKAEKEAEKNRQKMQEEADKHAKEVEQEVKEDEKDLQDKIDQANDQIDENNKDNDTSNDKPVNENDLGHGVDFDDDHSDENGNLDNSVENITTDPTGDKTNEPLPDPNETGKDFDAKGESMNVQSSGNNIVEYEEPVDDNSNNDSSNDSYVEYEEPVSSDDFQSQQWVEEVVVPDDTPYHEEAWVEYDEPAPKAEPKQETPKAEPKAEEPKQEAPKSEPKQETYEKAVDDYVESMANDNSDFGSNLEEEDMEDYQKQK